MGNKKVKCIIVSGAPDDDYDFLKEKLKKESYIIAADSGYLKCIKVNVIPDLIIGDFDSSPIPDVDTEIIRLPAEKDDTDTFYCVKKAIELGFKEIETGQIIIILICCALSIAERMALNVPL